MSLRNIWLIAGSGGVAGLAFAGWLLGVWGGDGATRAVDDSGLLFFAVFAAACSCVAVRRGCGRQRAAWIAMAAGLGGWVAGEAIWSYYELWQGMAQTPFPSPADAAFLLFPVGAAVALLLFPIGHSGQSRTRLVLDGLIVSGSLFVVSWVSVLDRVYQAGGTSHFALDVSLAYPVADLVTITITVLVLARARTAQRVTLMLLTAGIVLMALSDSAFVYLITLGTYHSGSLIDLGWVAGFLVLGLAALASTREPQANLEAAQVPARVRLWLPYVPLLLASVVGTVRFLPSLDAGPVPSVALVLVIAVLARQFIVVAENRRLLVTVADQAFLDPLTGLANRALFMDRLTHAVQLQQRDLRSVAILSLDLDDFKLVNDTLGHPAGDALLIRVAERLLGCLRTGDTVARLGGDEFSVLIEHGADHPLLVAHRVVDAFGAPFHIDGHSLIVRPSIGLATASADDAEVSPDSLLKQADVAMYSAKRAGTGGVHAFTPDMHLTERNELDLRQDLTRALGGPQLQVAYQPIIDVATGTVRGAEALARWNHPEHGPIPPARFIPMAEQAGLINQLGLGILDMALAEFAGWQQPSGSAPLVLTVNVSGHQLADPGFPGQVLTLLQRHHVAASQLILEISEAALLTHVEPAADFAAALDRSGVRLAIDDFGVGFSSLAHVTQFPVRLLKIDKAFVDRLDTEPDARAFFTALQQFGRSLGLEIVAEGVERPAQLAELRTLRCDLAQGYHLGRPVDGARMRESLQAPGPLLLPATS